MDLRFSKDEMDYASRGSWSTWTPTLTADGGGGPPVATVDQARYKLIGKTVYFNLELAITNINGSAGAMLATLPHSPNETSGATLAFGREGAMTGKSLQGSFVSPDKIRIVSWDNVNGGVFTNGYTLLVTGTYRIS